MTPLILASSSPYRRALLERLGLPFESISPGVDETPRSGESAPDLAQRLATAKAMAVVADHPQRTVIGSDQVASLDGACLGKPGNFERAFEQLSRCSGARVDFHTALSVSHDGRLHQTLELFSVHFRTLQDAEIRVYLQREQPYDCAGSFRWESLGIALFERLTGDDPTSLEGLPLIALCSILREIGIDPIRRDR